MYSQTRADRVARRAGRRDECSGQHEGQDEAQDVGDQQEAPNERAAPIALPRNRHLDELIRDELLRERCTPRDPERPHGRASPR